VKSYITQSKKSCPEYFEPNLSQSAMESKGQEGILNSEDGSPSAETVIMAPDIRQPASQQGQERDSSRATDNENQERLLRNQDAESLESPEFDYQDAELSLEVCLPC
jgi:hypothetical protein